MPSRVYQKGVKNLLFRFFVLGLLLTPLAEFYELDFLGHGLLVLAGPVVDALAGTAGEFYKPIL